MSDAYEGLGDGHPGSGRGEQVVHRRKERGAGAGGSPYLLNDLFNRYANATVMNGQLPLLGPAWTTTGAALPTISSGYCESSGTGYLYNILPSVAQALGGILKFSGGVDQTTKGMTIAYADNENPLVVNNLLHYNFGPLDFSLQVRQGGGAFFQILSGTFATPFSVGVDTETYLAVSGNIAAIIKGAEVFSVRDPRIALLAGQTVFWEPNRQVDGFQASLARAYALGSSGFPIIAPTRFNPFNTNSMTLSSGNQVATRSGAGTATARTVAGRSSGKVQCEFILTAHAFPFADTLGIGFGSIAQWPTNIALGNDFKGLALYPRGSNTGIWTANAYKVSGLNLSGAVGTRICMRVDIDANTVSFKDITNSSAFTTPFDFSAFVGGVPFAIGTSQDGADGVQIFTSASEMVTPLDNSYEPWL